MNTWHHLLDDTAGQQTYRDLVEKRNQSLNCFLEFDPGRRASAAASGLSVGTEAVGSGAQAVGSGTQAVGSGTEAGGSEKLLAGLPFAVKDNIAVKGFRLTCGSKILSNVLCPYDATAVARLVSAGAVPVGKTNLDEFGMGSSNQHSAFGGAANPWDLSRVPGGSSGGSAAAVAAGLVPFALGSDTGGSVRQPAAFCGVYGLKPTYGTVSRYGLVAYASSLDVIGVLSGDIDMVEAVYRTIAGEDPRDHSSTNPPAGGPGPGAPGGPAPRPWAPKRVAFLAGALDLDPAIQGAYDAARTELVAQGVVVEEIELSTLKYVVPAYYTIATAEAGANLARYNGVRYGVRPEYAENPDELVRKARDNGFGPEVKSRILLGTYVLRSGFQDQYYLRAQRIRTAIRNELTAAFGSYDLLMLPVFPVPAFAKGEAGLSDFQQKLADRFTCTANLAGTPGLSIPTGTAGGLPTAVQAMAPAFEEGRLFSVARMLAPRFPLETPADFPALATPAEGA